jgi:hypothetical protein
MILNTFGCPGLSWGEVADLGASVGIEHGRVANGSLSLWEASAAPLLLGNVRLVYLSALADLRRWVSRLEEDERGNILVIGASRPELENAGIPLRSHLDMLDLAVSVSEGPRHVVHLTHFCPIHSHIENFAGESLIGSIHTAFYRIEDKVLRKSSTQAVYEYLSGLRKRMPVTGIRKIDQVLSGPRTQSFIQVCKQVANDQSKAELLAKEFGFDSFEILFTLKKSGSL